MRTHSDARPPFSVSVIMPAFNAESTIAEAVDSALSQTVPPLEVLVMDDGSSDATLDRLRPFGDHVLAFSESNQGASAARNALIGRARGSWLAPLDADDIWRPHYLELQQSLVGAHPGAVVSLTRPVTVRSELSTERPAPADCSAETLDGLTFLRRLHDGAGVALPSFSLIARHAMNRLGPEPFPRDLSQAEDIFLWYRLAVAGEFIVCDAQGGYYRVHPQSLSHDQLRAFLARVTALERIHELFASLPSASWARLSKAHLQSTRRAVAKYLAGDGDIDAAKGHLRRSLALGPDWRALALLAALELPQHLQPAWPARYRVH